MTHKTLHRRIGRIERIFAGIVQEAGFEDPTAKLSAADQELWKGYLDARGTGTSEMTPDIAGMIGRRGQAFRGALDRQGKRAVTPVADDEVVRVLKAGRLEARQQAIAGGLWRPVS